MKASKAKRESDVNKELGLNVQRRAVLKLIENAINQAEYSITLSNLQTYIELYAEDYDWFESLGYKVTRPEVKMLVPKGFDTSKIRYASGVIVTFTESDVLSQDMFVPGSISWAE